MGGALALFLAAALPAGAAPLEDEAAALVSTSSLVDLLTRVSREPHVAGSKANDRLAAEIEKMFLEAGLEVSKSVYEVLLSHPKKASLELLRPERKALATPEGALLSPEQKKELYSVDLMPWNGYSPSGTWEGEVVYANYGRPEDYQALEAAGVSVKNRIVITRYGRGYRGGKTQEAEKRGAAGILFYSDPADDGWAMGDTMPRGPWGAPDHFQRGANVYDYIHPGDPLTPGWASTPDAMRLAREEVKVLPKIPSMPLSYADAQHILKNLDGYHLPGFQGALPFTYHAGPGPAAVRLSISNTEAVLPITNVLGRLRGAEEPEKLVIISSHHDAWTKGAVDDGIGTAIMIELARGFAKLARAGRRPRRTILFASWDAEEYTLTGSTEWGEEREEDLRKNGVALINLDAYRWGKKFTGVAVPSLEPLVLDALSKVHDPSTGKTLLEQWKADGAEGMGDVGSGSDYTVFLNRLGIPIVETMFTGTAGVYHSIYDEVDWVLKVDPELRYVAALAQLNARLAARLADDLLLPLEGGRYAERAAQELDKLKKDFPEHDVSEAQAAAADWLKAAQAFSAAPKTDARLPCANLRLMDLERALLYEPGIPNRPWFRHLFYAPRPTYEALTLPGVREALEAKDAARAAEQTTLLAAALSKAANAQQAAAACLEGRR